MHPDSDASLRERQKASCLHVVRLSHFLVIKCFFISILEYITPYSHPRGITQNKSGSFPNRTYKFKEKRI